MRVPFSVKSLLYNSALRLTRKFKNGITSFANIRYIYKLDWHKFKLPDKDNEVTGFLLFLVSRYKEIPLICTKNSTRVKTEINSISRQWGRTSGCAHLHNLGIGPSISVQFKFIFRSQVFHMYVHRLAVALQALNYK